MKYKDNQAYRIEEPYYKKTKKFRSKRIEGDAIYFFMLHNLISLMLFFIFATFMGVFDISTQMLSDLISWTFFRMLLIVFGLMLITGIIGRFIAYITLRIIVHTWKNRETKKLGEFLKGINGISMSYFFSTFISAVFFAFGALAIIQSKIFGESTIWTLVMTYAVVKVLVYFLSRLFSAWKL